MLFLAHIGDIDSPNRKEYGMKRIAFVEIPATNFERTVQFYETVLGVDLAILECETERMACFPAEDGRCPCAISQAKGFQPSADGVLVSLYVENMEDALDAICKQGGRMVQPKTKIEADGLGYFSVFIDCEGNRLGLYSDS